jgi:cysteine desulfurase
MRDFFEAALSSSDYSVSINGGGAQRHPGNSNLRFGVRDAHHLLSMMQPNLAASTGSACTSGTIESSHVLRAIGLAEEAANASVRFSFGRFNSEADACDAARIISEAIALDRAA